ncbi:MAG: MauE/DoxX family redox-associated membrane protein [Acidobacteriota bacterium]
MMDLVLLIVRLILFAVFALAAVGKFLDLKGSEKAVRDFGTPDEFAKTFAIALPFAEIVFAFCFLFVSTSWLGAIGALILLLAFSGGMVWQMAKGNAPDCHCFGLMHSEPISPKTLVRNIIFALLALFLIAQGRDGQGYGLSDSTSNTMQLIFILLVLMLAGVAIFYLKKIVEGQTEILRRIELLEVISREGVPLERSDAGSPHDGLPIGSPFPEFELTDTSGREVSRSTLLENGKPAVLFFVSATCEPCKALLPEMERWEAELGDRVNFALFSTGTVEANADKFAVFSPDVVLQKNRELADLVYARWTPTAIFIRADGTVGSHPAAGDIAIRKLIGTIRDGDPTKANFFVALSSNGAGQPKIGERIPEFALEDTRGVKITSSDLKGDRTLAVFWSLTCPHCTAMMKELKAWDASRGEADPQLIVFSDGPKEDHEDLGLTAPVVLDAGYKTSESLGMFGTPSAVIVDETGTIVSETAMGASNIWALIGKRK